MTGHVRQRSQGSWELVIYLGRGTDGKPKYQSRTVKGSKREADKALREWLNALEKGVSVKPTRETVSAYLLKWLEGVKPTLTVTSYERYEQTVRVHLIPELGSLQLDRLTAADVKAFHGRLLEKGFTAKSVLLYHRILGRALAAAVDSDLLIRNPCSKARPPKPETRKPETLGEDAIESLLTQTRGSRYHIAILIAATTGLRLGEIAALRWRDIDLERGLLTVRGTVAATKQGLSIKAPKTAKAQRPVVLPSRTVEALRRHKGEQAERRLLFGPIYRNNDLAFCREDGTLLRPSNVSAAISALMKRLGLSLTFHGLRHTHASHLLAENVHPKVVSERLGHANISITLDTYSHLLPSLQEEAARKIDLSLDRAARRRAAGE